MGKIAIYTCITGNYDSVKQPVQAPEGFDFILFVEKGAKHGKYAGVWKIEELPVSWEDKLLTSRFPKICPHSLLQNYEYSLWVDGSVSITSTKVYDRCLELAERGTKYAGVRHRFRDCAYDECEAALEYGRESLFHLMKITAFLGKNKLKPHTGLMENGIIFRKHNDPTVMEFDKLWWDRFVTISPKRDQLVHSVCLEDVPELEWCWFILGGHDIENSEIFELAEHSNASNAKPRFIGRKLKYGILNIKRLILHLFISMIKRKK